MTNDTGTEADAVERVAAAIWEAEYREMVGEPPYPWDSSEWDEPGHEGQMEIDRAKARAAIAAMQPAPVAVSEAMVIAGGRWMYESLVRRPLPHLPPFEDVPVEVRESWQEEARSFLTAALGVQEAPHPDDLAVDVFAQRMKAKLAKKRAEGRGGWEDRETCSAEFLSGLLREHVEKGDPVDVANLAMMLGIRGDRIDPLGVQEAPLEEVLGGDWQVSSVRRDDTGTVWLALIADADDWRRQRHGTGPTIDAAIRDAVRRAQDGGE